MLNKQTTNIDTTGDPLQDRAEWVIKTVGNGGNGDVPGGGTWRCVTAKPEMAVITFMPHTVGGRTPNVTCITSHSHLAA